MRRVIVTEGTLLDHDRFIERGALSVRDETYIPVTYMGDSSFIVGRASNFRRNLAYEISFEIEIGSTQVKLEDFDLSFTVAPVKTNVVDGHTHIIDGVIRELTLVPKPNAFPRIQTRARVPLVQNWRRFTALGFGGSSQLLHECPDCGAVVHDTGLHWRWHQDQLGPR